MPQGYNKDVHWPVWATVKRSLTMTQTGKSHGVLGVIPLMLSVFKNTLLNFLDSFSKKVPFEQQKQKNVSILMYTYVHFYTVV